MKNIKHIIYTIVLFLICITNTYAACTEEAIKEFKKLEDKYTVKYEYNKPTKDYTLTFYFADTDKYTYQVDERLQEMEYIEFNDTNFKTIVKEPGEYKINVTGFFENCYGVLKIINLKLPKYNKYSEDPICKGIEEFVLCNPAYDKEIDYDSFVSRVNTYKKSKNKEPEKPNEPVTPPENEILKYIKDNIIQIIIVVVFIILLIITACITLKSIRKSRRLE